MRSAGLSLPWLARPILLLAALGVLAGVVINFQCMPWARVRYHLELGNAVRLNPLSFIVPGPSSGTSPARCCMWGRRTARA